MGQYKSDSIFNTHRAQPFTTVDGANAAHQALVKEHNDVVDKLNREILNLERSIKTSQTSVTQQILSGGGGSSGGGTLHNLLSATHPDTLTANVIRGDLIVGQFALPLWARLALGTSGQYPRSNGTDLLYSNILDADLPATIVRTSRTLTINGTAARVAVTGGTQDLSANRTWTVDIDAAYVGQTSITTLGTITTGVWNGTTIAIANGGTGQTTALAAFNALSPLTTRGDMLTRDATNNIRIAIGGAATYWRSNGTDPSWQTISAADIGSAQNLSVGTSLSITAGTGTGATLQPITINTIQGIRTVDTPTFGSLTLSKSAGGVVTEYLLLSDSGTGVKLQIQLDPEVAINPRQIIFNMDVDGSGFVNIFNMNKFGTRFGSVIPNASPDQNSQPFFDLEPYTRTSGSPTAFLLVGASHTTLSIVELVDVNFNLARTVNFAAGGGTIATQRAALFQAPTYTATTNAVTLTKSATLAVSGAPIAGTNISITNPYAFWVQSGKTEFDGLVQIQNPTPNQLTVNSSGANRCDIFMNCTTAAQQTLISMADGGTTKWEFGKNTDNTFFLWDFANAAAILTITTKGLYVWTQGVSTSGSPTFQAWNAAAHTTLAIAEAIDFNFNAARTVNFTTGGGTITNQRTTLFQAPTYTATTNSVTLTSAATVAITGAPVASTNITITNSYSLWVQAGTSRFDAQLGVNANPASGVTMNLTQPVATSGSPTGFLFAGGAHTTLAASTEAIDVNFNLARTVQFAQGALTTQRAFVIQAPTYAFATGASTLTTAATFAITGAPITGTNATITNSYALWVQGGNTYLNGNNADKSHYVTIGRNNDTQDSYLTNGTIGIFFNEDVNFISSNHTFYGAFVRVTNSGNNAGSGSEGGHFEARVNNANGGSTGGVIGVTAVADTILATGGMTVTGHLGMYLGIGTHHGVGVTITATDVRARLVFCQFQGDLHTTNFYGDHFNVNTFSQLQATNFYWIKFDAVTNGTFTNAYGIYLDTISGTTAWGFYQIGTQNNFFNGKLALGGTQGSFAPTNTLSLSGQASQTIWMERETTSNTAGNSLTVQAGGATSGATDKAGGNLILVPGIPTGLGRVNTMLKGYTTATATGTGDGTQLDRLVLNGFKSLTNNTVTAIINFTVANNTVVAGIIHYAVEVFNGTDVQIEEGQISFHVTNKGGVLANNVVLKYGNQQAVTALALTCTWTITAANPAVVSLNANSTLGTIQTGYPRLTYAVFNLTQQAIALQ